MVPQVKYKCGNSQGDWNRLPDIHFRVKGMEGIKLTNAMSARFNGLDGRDDPMFTDVDVGNSVSCRIAVCASYDNHSHSYSNGSISFKDASLARQGRYVDKLSWTLIPWVKHKQQIPTINYKKERTRITRKKLAEFVAKRIGAYLEDLKVSR